MITGKPCIFHVPTSSRLTSPVTFQKHLANHPTKFVLNFFPRQTAHPTKQIPCQLPIPCTYSRLLCKPHDLSGCAWRRDGPSDFELTMPRRTAPVAAATRPAFREGWRQAGREGGAHGRAVSPVQHVAPQCSRSGTAQTPRRGSGGRRQMAKNKALLGQVDRN